MVPASDSRRLRLMLCTPRFAPQLGGAETWTREVAAALGEKGHGLTVVARAAPGVPASAHLGPIEVVRVAGSRLALGREVARRMRTIRPDAVLAQYSALPWAVAASRLTDIPSVGVVHDVYGLVESVRIKGPRVGVIRTLGLEQWLRILPPDAFLVPSRATGSRLAKVVARKPITVVPAGSDHLPEGEPLQRNPTRLVFVGRLVHQKGVGDIIEAMRILHARAPRCTVLIVGEGPERAALEQRAQGLGKAVQFAGSLSDEALDREIRASLALLLPSRREGWGLAVTEAASRGTAYIAYDIPAVREQHELVRGGLLVAPGPERLATAIAELLEDPARAMMFGKRGREAAAEMTWARSAAVVEDLVVELARGGTGP